MKPPYRYDSVESCSVEFYVKSSSRFFVLGEVALVNRRRLKAKVES